MKNYQPIKKQSNVYGYDITLNEKGYFEALVKTKDDNVIFTVETAMAKQLVQDKKVSDPGNVAEMGRYLRSIGIVGPDVELQDLSEAKSSWSKEDQVNMRLFGFSGFYESTHDERIDRAIEDMFSDDQGDVHIPEDFFNHYVMPPAFKADYAKSYVGMFSEYIADELEFPLPSLTFDSVSSPREYNFETDKIIASVSVPEIEHAITEWMSKASPNELELARTYIANRLQSRSGFHSFYDDLVERTKATDNIFEWFGGPIADADCIVIGAVVSSLIGEIDDDKILDAGAAPFSEEVNNLVYKHLPAPCKAMARQFSDCRSSEMQS